MINQIQNQVFSQGSPATLNSGPPPPPPAAPSVLTLDGLGSDFGSILLSWTNNAAPAATTNEIWVSLNGAAYNLYDTVSGLANSYNDPGNGGSVTNGDVWQYKVRATNGGGSSAFTNDVGAAQFLGDLGALTYNYPTLVVILGGFTTVASGVTSVNLPKLQAVQGDLALLSEGSLTTLNVPLLSFVRGNLFVTDAGSLSDLLFPSLTTVNVDVNLSGAVTATGFDLSALSGKVGEFNLNSLASFVGNLSLPNLGLITGNAFLQSLGATGVSFATLTSVTGAFLCDSNSDMVTLSLPVLASTGDLSISSSGLATISLPSLTTVSGNLNLMNNGSITSIVAAALSFANGDIDFTGNTIIVTVSLGGLVDITGNFAVNSLNALTTLTLTSLSTVGGQIDFSADPVLASVSLPALSSMGGGIMGANCTSLTSLSIGGGVTINSDLIMSGCTVLATVSIPNVQFNDGGFSCDFGNCAVTVGSAAAGTGVDGILRRCNLSALANETILLNGGTNASPTGGITNADYVDLTSNGCVVLIN